MKSLLATPAPWRRALPLLLVLLAFALLAAGDLARGRMLGWDESEYAGLGRDLLRGEGYQCYGRPEAMRLPMLPLLAAGTLAVAPRSGDTGLRVTALLAMLAAIAATAHGVARTTDRATGFAAALLLAAMPMIRVLAPLVLSEGPFLLWFGIAVWAFHDGLEGRSRSFLVCGAAIGLAALTRYVAWMFAPVAVLVLLVRLTTLGPRELARRTLGRGAFWLAPLVALVVVAPWLVRAVIVFGDPLEGVRESLESVGSWGREPWSWYLMRLPLTAGWPVLIAAALGVVVAVRERGGAAMTALIAAVVVIAAHARWSHKEDRYVVAALPFLATLAALGLSRVAAPLLGRLAGARAAALAVPALAVVAALATMRGDAVRRLDFSPAGDPVFERAMAVVRANSAPRDMVLGASGPLIHWYADRPARQLPERREQLPRTLRSAAWVVFVNYERMQPAWADDLMRSLATADTTHGEVRVLLQPPYQIVLARAPALAARLAGEGGADASR